MDAHVTAILDTVTDPREVVAKLLRVPEIAAVIPMVDGSPDILRDLRSIFAHRSDILELIDAAFDLFELKLSANIQAKNLLSELSNTN